MNEGTPPPDLATVVSSVLDDVPGGDPVPGIRFTTPDPIGGGGNVASVDGGSSVVLNARTAGLYSIRAGYLLSSGDHHRARITTRKVPRGVSRKEFPAAWSRIRREYGWGVDLSPPNLDNAHFVAQLSDHERGLAELDAARRALYELRGGDLLLLDGSLEDQDPFTGLRELVLGLAHDQHVSVAALTKDTSRSLGGILPFTWELEDAAQRASIPTPWIAEATDGLRPRPDQYRVFAVRFDRRAAVFRLDVAGPDPVQVAGRILALCNDPAYPGYPYPLARIHHLVHFENGEAADLRHDLERVVAAQRGDRWTTRLFSHGRDVLKLAD